MIVAKCSLQRNLMGGSDLNLTRGYTPIPECHEAVL
jgi:hypothetical protein